MDAYIRNELSISSDLTLDEAATHSVKLLTWLLDCQDEMQQEACTRQDQEREQQLQLQLTYTDIECMFKATLYLYECHARHGDELVDAVLQQCSSAQASIRRFYENCERDGGVQCIRELCASIVAGTRHGQTHAPLLYQMHKAYADVQPSWGIIKELDWSAIVAQRDRSNDTLDVATAAAAGEQLNTEVQQMRHLVRRIFRLANLEEIRTALERAMQLVGCELWLHLFREPKEGLLYTRCYILRQMICDMLTAGGSSSSSSGATSSAGFVHNIYKFVADETGAGAGNVSRFLRMLMHVRLAAALSNYVRCYWQQFVPHLQVDDDMQLDAEAPLAPVPLEQMLYLSHLLLTSKSPCRTQFYEELRQLPLALNKRLLEVLNKVAYVYS